MAVLHRNIQHVYPDKWVELEEIEKKITAAEAKCGFPPKKRYALMSGSDLYETLVIEYEWESLAALETAYEKLFADPDMLNLAPKYNMVIKDTRIEYYRVLT
jgi:hypothetical protein